MRRLAALAALALLVVSCAHRPRAASPAPPAPPAAAPRARLEPPAPPPAQEQHAPLWYVRGAVIDARSRRPLENAAVAVLSRTDDPAADPWQPSVATGADGRFTLHFPAPGDYRVKVAALGYRSKIAVLHVAVSGPVPYRMFRLPVATVADEVPARPSPNPQDPHGP